MDFQSLLKEARSENDCSQVFIHFAGHQPAWTVMQRVEELGGEVLNMKIRQSDKKGYKIAFLKLDNAHIQEMVVALNENGLFEVQGIGRRILRTGG